MSSMFWVVLAVFVLTDLVVIAIVVRRMSSMMWGLTLPGGADRGRILQSAHAMIGEHLRVNYSGDPGALPGVLAGLLPRLRDLLRSHGIEPTPEVIRAFVQVSAAKHRIATTQQLRDALATIG